MRDFFLGDEKLTSCGVARNGPGGIAYFCQTCGEVWGKCRLGWSSWLAANQPCGEHGNKQEVGGTYLRHLIWWDNANGNHADAQLKHASPELIRYEAQVRANWVEKFGGQK